MLVAWRQSYEAMRGVGIKFPHSVEVWYGSRHPNTFSLDRWQDDGGALGDEQVRWRRVSSA